MRPSRVLSVTQVAAGESQSKPKKARRGCHPTLTFSEEDKDGTTQPHNDALVVTLRIGDYNVKRVMVDGGSAAEVMYPDLYKGLGLKPEDLSPYSSPLMSFDRKLVILEGVIKLLIQTGPEVVEVDFIVVNTYSPYTTIVGRPWLHTLGGVASSLHQKEKEELLEFLRRNLDVFAWDPCDAPGIDPSFICHHLNVNPSVTPKKQPPRRPSKEHATAIKEEVNKLKRAGAIKEIFYPEWLANTMVVKKKSEKLKVCVDFTDLNKACPKDPFPMPRIDQLVDATASHPRMSFLDAFQGYHQIPLALEDQEKTAFITPIGNYHYKVMPFGLKNAGSTYQRMMTRMFEPLLGKNIEIYVDDMVVKSKLVSEHLGDLGCIFDVLRKYRLRLNASKCSFGMGSGKFLGYIITHRGIEVDPDQIRAIQNLMPLRNPKEIQKLAGMIAALNRFISRSADRCRPFYLLINKWKGFEWSEECAMAFQQLKDYLARPPIISNPEVDKVLYAYIAVAHHTVSLVLIRDDSGIQKPVYYVSKLLHEAEVKYSPLEKAILAVVHAMQKLPHYFQAHTVVVLTQLPLKFVLRATDYTGRIAKWNTILGAFDVKYMPRTAIKGQVLADLTAKFAEPTIEVGAEGRIAKEKPVGAVSVPRSPCWKVYVDGAANHRGSEVGLVLVSPEDHVIEKSLRLGFLATNNEAEYEALLQGMVMAQKMGGKSVEIFSDSKLVVRQVKGEMEAKDSRMQEYLSQVKRLQSEFSLFSLSHIPRSGNSHADSLATLTTSSATSLPRIILVEHLKRAGEVAREAVPIHQVGVGPSWMDPITRFLKDDVLPEEKSEAEKIRRSASRFWLSEDHKLYRRSYSGPYLLCAYPEAVELLLEELYEGI
ncbi:uncharacterized protein LOC136062358 [Quercus suber]|uniref:uncharacterized protein LOC136062358 n=1 Tax=Quercus suber TaxID=58331 RepID=UPI0032DF874D